MPQIGEGRGSVDGRAVQIVMLDRVTSGNRARERIRRKNAQLRRYNVVRMFGSLIGDCDQIVPVG